MSMMKLIPTGGGAELPIEMTDVTLLPETLLAKEVTANKGEPNGYAGLDPAGKVSLTNLPSSLLLYKGVWNATTNTPTLPATDVDRKFHVYIVSVEGHQFGIDFYVGDWLIYNEDGIAEKSNNSDLVSSVNGYAGHVELDADDLLAGEFNKFVTDDDKVAWDGAVTDQHTHTNKSDLDAYDPIALQNTIDGKKNAHGFENRTDTTIAVVGTDFVITGAHNVYRHGVKIPKVTASIAIPQVDDLYFVYYDATNALTISVDPWVFGTDIPIAVVYVNLASGYLIGDERHGRFSLALHEYAHNVFGTQYASGLSAAFTNTTFQIENGVVYDEDIKHTIPTTTQTRIFYRDGLDMTFTAKGTNPYQISGSIQYDNDGVLTPLGSNNYMAFWVFATNFVDDGIIIIAGQRSDITLTAARENNTPQTINYASLNAPEKKLLYRVIVRNDATPYEEIVDYRATSVQGAVVNVTDHQTLTNRSAADSHPIGAITGLQTIADDSHTHANKATLDGTQESFTTALKGSYDGAVTDQHTHANKAILDGTQESFTTALKSSYDGAVTDQHTHANKTDLDNYDPANFASSTHNHNLNDLTEKSYNSLADKPDLTSFLTAPTVSNQNSLIFNYNTSGYRYILASIYDDWTFNVTNLPFGIPIVFWVMANTTNRTITIPDTSTNIVEGSRSIVILTNTWCEVSVVSNGSLYFWQYKNGMVPGG